MNIEFWAEKEGQTVTDLNNALDGILDAASIERVKGSLEDMINEKAAPLVDEIKKEGSTVRIGILGEKVEDLSANFSLSEASEELNQKFLALFQD